VSRNSEPIQVQPVGLLGLLQLKNVGVNPDVLIGTVQPTVDLLEQWLQQDLTTDIPDGQEVLASQGFTVLTTAAGILKVPASEVWWVHSFSVASLLQAGNGDELRGFRAAVAYKVGTPTVKMRFFEDGCPTRLVATANCQVVSQGGGFWAPSGTAFGVWVGERVSMDEIPVLGNLVVTRARV